MTESAVAKPLNVQISCALPFALYAEGQFQARLRHGEVSVLLQRVRQERLDPRIGIEKTDCDVRGDRSGFVSYTRLNIQMEWSVFEELARDTRGSNDVEKIQGVAHYVANRIIESYRHATMTPWVHTVAAKQLFNLSANITMSDGVAQAMTVWQSGMGPITLPINGVSDEKRRAFEQILQSGSPPPIWDSLWLDCEDAVDRGDPTSAIIRGHSALETLAHATVLAWLRDQNLDVGSAVDRLGRGSDEKRRLRKSLSLEELTESLNDTRKVEFALLDVGNPGAPWYRHYQCTHFERLAAARNEVLHSGAEVTLAEAQEHLEVIRAIRAELSRRENLDRISRSRPQPASAVMSAYLDRPPNDELTAILEGYEDSGFEVTFRSQQRHPLPRYRHPPGVSVLYDPKRIRVFLPIRSKKSPVDPTSVELALARSFLTNKLIDQGWPFADVAASGYEGESDLGPSDWTRIAPIITDSVLGWEVDRQLGEWGFATKQNSDRAAKAIEAHIREPVFREPKWGELDYFLLPLRLVVTFLDSPEVAGHLVDLLRTKAPGLAGTVKETADLIKKSDWKTPESAATAMLVLKNSLLALDSVGVREAPARRLRTRFTDTEIAKLRSP